MSNDAGGLAQMTYSSIAPSGLGVPAAGFASRGKGSQLKRLNLASPPKVAPISENHPEQVTTPRTSRSHLLAGLRTAPKTPTANAPSSAPHQQTQHSLNGLQSSRFAGNNNFGGGVGQGMPQTAIGSSFSTPPYDQFSGVAGQQFYTLPEQVLSPPPVQFDTQEDENLDPNVLAQLMATELFLEQRRKQLQQQLLQLTSQGMQINAMPMSTLSQQFSASPVGVNLNAFSQQAPTSAPQEVPGQPGVYVAYNQQIGQYQYVTDRMMQQMQQNRQSPTSMSPVDPSSPVNGRASFRADLPVSTENSRSPFYQRTSTPPKKTPSPPQNVTPLPPPSANAFRRGHKKVSSLGLSNATTGDGVENGPKSALARPVGLPATPMTGTFGPGQGRAGEHPIRQPRGPPPLEELQAAPTTKFENGKNFASRQRRRAVNSLVRAGMERRGVRTESGGSGSPVSEPDLALSLSSDNDSDSIVGSLSGRPSIGSLRAAANVAIGAIGSERKERKERERGRRIGSAERGWSVNSVSSDEGVSVGGKLMEVRPEEALAQAAPERRQTPILVLTNAEQRKSALY